MSIDILKKRLFMGILRGNKAEWNSRIFFMRSLFKEFGMSFA